MLAQAEGRQARSAKHRVGKLALNIAKPGNLV